MLTCHVATLTGVAHEMRGWGGMGAAAGTLPKKCYHAMSAPPPSPVWVGEIRPASAVHYQA